jgi:hypothetical protein
MEANKDAKGDLLLLNLVVESGKRVYKPPSSSTFTPCCSAVVNNCANDSGQ